MAMEQQNGRAVTPTSHPERDLSHIDLFFHETAKHASSMTHMLRSEDAGDSCISKVSHGPIRESDGRIVQRADRFGAGCREAPHLFRLVRLRNR